MQRADALYEARSKVHLGQSLRELWRFREVVWAFASRAVRVRYKQLALGVVWVVLQPLAFMMIFSVFFGRVIGIRGGGAPYAASTLAALIAWTFVAGAVGFGANSLVEETNVLRKVYFPREAPVIGALLASLLDLGVSVVLAILLMPFLGGHLGVELIALPVVVIALVVPVLGVVLPLAAFNVYYRDLRYALPFAIQLWLFASPIAYPLSQIPDHWRNWYSLVNPLVAPIDGLRRVLAVGEWPDWELTAASTGIGLVLLVAGYRIFKGLEAEFADVI